MCSDDGGCDWYCDGCGIELNAQPGFTVRSGTWTCEVCGYNNDVSSGNVIGSEEAAIKSEQFEPRRVYADDWKMSHDETGALGDIVFTCPYCSAMTSNMLVASVPRSEILRCDFETDQQCSQCDKDVVVVCTSSNYIGSFFG